MAELCKACGRSAPYLEEDKMASHVMFGHMPDPALCVECLHRALIWAARQAMDGIEVICDGSNNTPEDVEANRLNITVRETGGNA